LRLEDSLWSDYRRAWSNLTYKEGYALDDGQYGREVDREWSKWMPWERPRALRMLNLLTSTAIERLRQMNERMQGVDEIGSYVIPDRDGRLETNAAGTFFSVQYNVEDRRDTQIADERANWLRTTHPTDLNHVGDFGLLAAFTLARFESGRRATIMVLAVQAYRLEHHRLPDSLKSLSRPDLSHLMIDPYTGLDFHYFPNGLPENPYPPQYWTSRVAMADHRLPCIWSQGPELEASINFEGVFFQRAKWGSTQSAPALTYADAWSRGHWFPIAPAAKTH
jgi:hypothetical protein